MKYLVSVRKSECCFTISGFRFDFEKEEPNHNNDSLFIYFPIRLLVFNTRFLFPYLFIGVPHPLWPARLAE